jgi:hypothetical protein
MESMSMSAKLVFAPLMFDGYPSEELYIDSVWHWLYNIGPATNTEGYHPGIPGDVLEQPIALRRRRTKEGKGFYFSPIQAVEETFKGMDFCHG